MITKSWRCIDCDVDTAPGLSDMVELELAFKVADPGKWIIAMYLDDQSEVYVVHYNVWKQAGMEPWGGCLCIGCLEKRLGRQLKPKDFTSQPLNRFSRATKRLRSRRKE
jgi:hypothetical protein